MSGKELMIGDWVKTPKGFFKVTDIQDNDVIGTDYNNGEGTDSLFFNDEIEPIHLTAEILENNGFTRLGTDYILKGEHFGLDNPSIPSNYLDNYWLRISIKAVHIEYVHQLQHALRLCGIEKEIEL